MTHQVSAANIPPFKIVRCVDHETLSQVAAQHLATQLERKPHSLLILATGKSPERAYQLLAQRGRAKPALCDRLRILKLDEWGGLEMDDPATCETALRRTLIDPLGIAADRFEGWHSSPWDIPSECARIQQWLTANGPADVCVLGLGFNGHLGFNEPAESATAGPHRAKLSRESREHSMLKHARSKPVYGLTLGVRDILSSREILLLVSGAQKVTQLRRLLEPEISPQFPASFLWLHPAVSLYCDEASLPEG